MGSEFLYWFKARFARRGPPALRATSAPGVRPWGPVPGRAALRPAAPDREDAK
jgi:hypothetical protein